MTVAGSGPTVLRRKVRDYIKSSMDKITRIPRRKFLVVTENVVVGEDLSELLALEFSATTDLRSHLRDAWGHGYAAAFFDIKPALLAEETRVRAMADEGTSIIVFDGEPGTVWFGDLQLIQLAQPFRSEDVIRLLRSIGVDQTTR